jgi:hypothetical protein
MKCVLEFGIKGGFHVDNIQMPTVKLGARVAATLVTTLSQGRTVSSTTNWTIDRLVPRVMWQSTTHFVALTVLDGVKRGPASAILWKRKKGN